MSLIASEILTWDGSPRRPAFAIFGGMRKVLDYFAEVFIIFAFSAVGTGLIAGFAFILGMNDYAKAFLSVDLMLLASTLVAFVAGWTAYFIGKKVCKWKD